MNPTVPSRRPGRRIVVLALLVAGIATGGCGRKITAKVNGDPIYEDDFQKRTVNFRNAQPGDGAGLQTLAAMVNDIIVLQEAKRDGVAPDDAAVNQRMQLIAQQLAPRGITLEQFLQRSGVTLESARQEMHNDLTRRNLMTKGIQLSEAEIKKFYDDNKKNFTTPEQVTIRQITVPTQAEAQEAARDLKGADFGLVAISRSKDMFKQQGGLVPTFARGQIPANGPVSLPVQEQAFKMKEGEISKPIPNGSQWVIVKLDKKIPAKTPSFEETKEAIREGLLQQKAQQNGQFDRVQQRLVQLRQQADIEILDAQFKGAPQFQKQPAASPGGVPGAGGGLPPTGGEPGATRPPTGGGSPPAGGAPPTGGGAPAGGGAAPSGGAPSATPGGR